MAELRPSSFMIYETATRPVLSLRDSPPIMGTLPGHHNVHVTTRYAHLAPDSLKVDVDRIPA